MRMPRIVGRLLAMAAVLVPAGGTAFAGEGHVIMGAGVGYSTRFEQAFGAVEFFVPINDWFVVVPNGSYTEAAGVHRWLAGVELQWNAPAHKLHPRLMAWAGAGMSVLTEDPKGKPDPTTNDLVANVVAGVAYDMPAAPFLQVRVMLTDPTDVGLSVGVRF